MGIPVWLLRPADRLVVTTMNILTIRCEDVPDGVVLDDWEDDLGQPDPYPLIYNGPPGTEMLWVTQRMGCAFQDLTQVTRVLGNGSASGDTPSTSGLTTNVSTSALTQMRDGRTAGKGRARGKQHTPGNKDALRCEFFVIILSTVISHQCDSPFIHF